MSIEKAVRLAANPNRFWHDEEMGVRSSPIAPTKQNPLCWAD